MKYFSMLLSAFFIVSVSASDPFSMGTVKQALPSSEKAILKEIASRDWENEYLFWLEKADIEAGYDNKVSLFEGEVATAIDQVNKSFNAHEQDQDNKILKLIIQAYQALGQKLSNHVIILLEAKGLLKEEVAQRCSSNDMDVD